MSKLKILAIVDYYLPGYKGGGPIVSVSRMIQQLHKQFDFVVYTRDRDLGDKAAYPEIQSGTINQRDDCRVFYARPNQLNVQTLNKLIKTEKPDVIYLNSYFSKLTRIALLMRKLGKTKGIRFVLAPRGEFSPGALQLKGFKKSVYLKAAATTRFHDSLLWHVSSPLEKKEAIAALKNHPDVYVLAPDLMQSPNELAKNIIKPKKRSGHAKFAWISRISPKKNLLGAIEALKGCQGTAELTVFGPIEDEAYWNRCLEAVAELPAGITFEHRGGIPSSEVVKNLSQSHFFIFPTLGENFGHVIPEALSAGCPVILSDQTPWQFLEEHGAGWVLPLDPLQAWTEKAQHCIDMDSEAYQYHSKQCFEYLERRMQDDDTEKSAGLFFRAVAV